MKLLELATTLRVLGIGTSEESLEGIGKVSGEHESVLRSVVERLPSALVRSVSDTLVVLTDPTEHEVAGSAALRRVLLEHGSDVRSYREATALVRSLDAVVPKGSALDKAVDDSLTTLDGAGAMGLLSAQRIARFLVAMRKRGGQLSLQGTMLRAGDEALDLDWLRGLDKGLVQHDPTWGAAAVSRALHPETDAYGSLPKVELDPRRALVVEETSQALLPGRVALQRWIRVDPVPAPFRVDDPLAELLGNTLFRAPDGSHPLVGETSLEQRSLAQVLYTGFRVTASLLLDTWWVVRFKVGIRLDPRRAYRVFYRPGDLEIEVWSHPLSAWAIVHELAHAVDDQLVEGAGSLASETPGNPVAVFVDAIRPLYRDMAERRAQIQFDGLIKAGFGKRMVRQIDDGLVRLHDLLEAATWVEDAQVDRVQSLIVSEAAHPAALQEALGRPVSRAESLFLGEMSDSLVMDESGDGWVNLKGAFETYRQDILEYLLSSGEIFARFFDQYARMYWRQCGVPYGPQVREGDLDPSQVAKWAPRFLKALEEAQRLDLETLHVRLTGERSVDTLVSGALCVGLVAIGADILVPPS